MFIPVPPYLLSTITRQYADPSRVCCIRLALLCFAFASAEEFLAQYDPQILGCFVLDVARPTLNGLEL